MNRKLYVGIMSFFAVVFTISITFLPYYNPIYFYLQHISLFLFMAMFIYYLLKLGYDRLQKRVQKTNLLKGYTITVFVVLLFLFSNVQLYAIETYQTPEFHSCFYYDEYFNPIYYSQLSNNCPEIEIVEQTESYLKYQVIEELSGNDDYDYMDGVDLENVDFSSTVTTYSELLYDDSGHIIESTISKFSSILLEDGRTIVNSIVNHVENIILYEENRPVGFESYQTTSQVDDIFSSHYDPNTVTEDEYIKYVSAKTDHELNHTTIEDMYQILIYKKVFDNPNFEGDPIENEVIQQLDFICDETECNVKREDFNLPIADYLALVENDMASSDLDYTYTINANKIDIKYPYYHYQDNEKSFTTISYSNFKDYQALFFESNTKSYTNMLNRPIERSSFKYGGNYYLEHGDMYSVIYHTDYGYRIVNRPSTMEAEQNLGNVIVSSSSIYFMADLFYRVEDMYDYGLRATYNLSDRDEVVYFYNPLIFRLIESRD